MIASLLYAAVNRIRDREPGWKAFDRPMPPASAIPAKRGAGVPGAGASNRATGGIASPLTEPSASARTYHAQRTVQSSDGVFQVRIAPVKQISMTDANGASVVCIYAAPT